MCRTVKSYCIITIFLNTFVTARAQKNGEWGSYIQRMLRSVFIWCLVCLTHGACAKAGQADTTFVLNGKAGIELRLYWLLG